MLNAAALGWECLAPGPVPTVVTHGHACRNSTKRAPAPRFPPCPLPGSTRSPGAGRPFGPIAPGMRRSGGAIVQSV